MYHASSGNYNNEVIVSVGILVPSEVQ